MPLPFIHSTTSLFGLAYTGVRGLLLAGSWDASTAPSGPSQIPSGIALIQPGIACSTGGAKLQVVSTLPAGIAAANFVYIPQTTGGIATSSFASGESAPPQTGMGAALIWDAANRRLGVYSTASGSGVWVFSHTGITTSAAAAGFTSS